MDLQNAMGLMDAKAYEKLNDFVTVKPSVDTTGKNNCDILMAALCAAVNDEIIKVSSLDDKLIKMLNSSTNTLSQTKLIYLLNVIHKAQPDLKCVIRITSGDMSETIKEWTYQNPYDIRFVDIFGYVINKFQITPSKVTSELSKTLLTTIVNNVAQLVSKFLSFETDEQKQSIVISIMTINRLVNMEGCLMLAEFKS